MIINEYELLTKDDGTSGLIISSQYEITRSNAKLDTSDEVYTFMEEIYALSKKAEENLYVVAANNKCRVLGVFFIARGTVNMCPVSPREVLIRALLLGATSIIMVHNHPSGETEPSLADISITERFGKACCLIGLNLLDHIIIGRSFTSLKQLGYIPEPSGND